MASDTVNIAAIQRLFSELEQEGEPAPRVVITHALGEFNCRIVDIGINGIESVLCDPIEGNTFLSGHGDTIAEALVDLNRKVGYTD